MRVVISAPARYHFFDLGRQLNQRGLLAGFMTGYPMFKLKDDADLAPYIQSLPYFHVLYRAVSFVTGHELEYWDRWLFDLMVSRCLPPCDVFMGIAASCLKTSHTARAHGASVVVDRPCTHIVYQNRILQEEAKREDLFVEPIDPRVIKAELAEYDYADIVTVPSKFAYRSFLEQGFPEEKLRVIPYGVDHSRFHPVGEPDPETFDVLFVGLATVRKGTHRLLRVFERLKHPMKRLTLVGNIQTELHSMIREYASRLPISVLGHIPQAELKGYMSRCHVFVLPSIEDGYGLVMSQAMACGAPVVASQHTGAEMLLTEGKDGFIFPAGDDDALLDCLQRLADNPDMRSRMSQEALKSAQALGGWSIYADNIVSMFDELRG